MDAERWRQLDQLLEAALALPEERRGAFVAERCADDEELRRRAERLLAAERAAEGFLETPPFADLESVLAAAAAGRERAALAPGTVVGRYVVGERVGAGGMGTVYAAHDPELDRTIAVKLVHLDHAAGQSRQRLLREAQALARVSSPNVVTVHDVGNHDDAVFLAMEYVAGGTLEDWLRQRRRGWREIVAAFAAAGRGLAAAHAAGIVHRDFKPANVLRDGAGRLRVADFGLARAAAGGGTAGGGAGGEHGVEPGVDPAAEPPLAERGTPPAAGRLASPLTGTGWQLGTPPYMAPEQHAGGDVGPATDQFAFCVALYLALYGEHPFAAGSDAETRSRVLAGTVAPPPKGRRLPGWLRAAVVRGLAVEPAERWGSMDELVRALERGSRRPSRRAVTTAALLAVAVVAVLVLVWRDRRDGATAPAAASASLAVLPFANDGPNDDDEYLSQGITDELIATLARVEPLRVPARTSVYALAGRGLSVPQLARRLDVGHVLAGTVRHSEDQVRVSAHLVDTGNGAEVWARTYRRRMADLYDLEEEIARDVLDHLVPAASSALPLVHRRTANIQAYSLYLKGRSHWNRRTSEGFRQAVDYFKRAIAEDPGYALGYSGLADSFSMMRVYDPDPPPDVLIQARAAALHALKLDPQLAEAHASLGTVLIMNGHPAAAEAELKRAIELEPRYATAHHWYGLLLTRMLFRPRAGVVELELARQLDPASSPIMAMLVGAYYNAGMHRRALATERELRVLDPDWDAEESGHCASRIDIALRRWDDAAAAIEQERGADGLPLSCRRDLALLDHLRGDYAAELEVARRGLGDHPGDLYLLQAEGGALAALGRTAEVGDLFDRVLATAGPDDLSRYALYPLLGELRVHGHAAAGRRLAGELVAWHQRRAPVRGDELLSAMTLAVAHIEAGDAAAGADVLARWFAAAGPEQRRQDDISPYQVAGLEGWAAALQGRRTLARERLRSLATLEADSETPPYEAIILAALGERQAAFQALRARLDRGLVLNRDLHTEVGLEPLRGNPELEELLPRVVPAPATDG